MTTTKAKSRPVPATPDHVFDAMGHLFQARGQLAGAALLIVQAATWQKMSAHDRELCTQAAESLAGAAGLCEEATRAMDTGKKITKPEADRVYVRVAYVRGLITGARALIEDTEARDWRDELLMALELIGHGDKFVGDASACIARCSASWVAA